MMMSTLTLAQSANVGWLTKQIFGEAGANQMARDSDAIFMWIFWFSTFWFVLLMGLMGYWVIKYRRRPGVPPERSPHHNTTLELAWTILPSLFLGYMFYIGFQGYLKQLVAPTDAIVYDVEGAKWLWRVTYPNGATPADTVPMGGNVGVPVIVVPVGTPVQFRMTSADVMHSFWIPDFRFKFDVLPNRYSSFWIEAEEVGEHVVYCAEYCGDSHSEMAALLKVMSEEDYITYMNKPKGPGEGETMAEWGKRLSVQHACVTCHTANGGAGIGPTWLNAWGYEVPIQGGPPIPADDPDAWDNYVVESIRVPTAKFHQGYGPLMSPYAYLSDEEVRGLLAYIRSLSDKAPAAFPEGEPTEEEEAAQTGGES